MLLLLHRQDRAAQQSGRRRVKQISALPAAHVYLQLGNSSALCSATLLAQLLQHLQIPLPAFQVADVLQASCHLTSSLRAECRGLRMLLLQRAALCGSILDLPVEPVYFLLHHGNLGRQFCKS